LISDPPFLGFSFVPFEGERMNFDLNISNVHHKKNPFNFENGGVHLRQVYYAENIRMSWPMKC
jgi:hypothetical protein